MSPIVGRSFRNELRPDQLSSELHAWRAGRTIYLAKPKLQAVRPELIRSGGGDMNSAVVWERGATWPVGSEGIRQVEIGRRAFEASREEREVDTRFLAIVRRGIEAVHRTSGRTGASAASKPKPDAVRPDTPRREA